MSEQMDDFAFSVEREAPALPMPPMAPGEFVVRIGEGWADGPSRPDLGMHDLVAVAAMHGLEEPTS